MPDPYISEVKFLGAGNQDFVEIALEAGTDPSTVQFVVYHPSGNVRTINDLGDVDSTSAGKDVYSIDSAESDTFNGVHKNGAVALVQDGVVLQFISFESTVTANNGPAAGMSSTALGGTGNGESVQTTDNGSTYGVNTAPSKGTIPCFLAGTLIDTNEGLVPVETLSPGDHVITRDRGPQKILWTGKRQLTVVESSDPKCRPIRIPTNALGLGQPAADTYVSPNHRVFISHPLCHQLFGRREVFLAAKFLVGYHGIGDAPVALPIEFHHILLENHEAISANGLGVESLFHGAVASEGFATAELNAFAPHQAPARRVLKSGEANQLLRELQKEKTFHLKVS